MRRTGLVVGISAIAIIFVMAIAIAVLLFVTRSSTDGLSFDAGISASERVIKLVNDQTRVNAEDARSRQRDALDVAREIKQNSQPVSFGGTQPQQSAPVQQQMPNGWRERMHGNGSGCNPCAQQAPAPAPAPQTQQTTPPPPPPPATNPGRPQQQQNEEEDKPQAHHSSNQQVVVIEQRRPMKEIIVERGIEATGRIIAARVGRPTTSSNNNNSNGGTWNKLPPCYYNGGDCSRHR